MITPAALAHALRSAVKGAETARADVTAQTGDEVSGMYAAYGYLQANITSFAGMFDEEAALLRDQQLADDGRWEVHG